jgi:hypothetical protein
LFFGRIVSGYYVSLLFHSWPHGLLNFRIQNARSILYSYGFCLDVGLPVTSSRRLERLNPHIHRMSSPALSVVFGGFLVVLTVALINPDVGLFLIPVHAFVSVILATKRKWHLRKYF